MPRFLMFPHPSFYEIPGYFFFELRFKIILKYFLFKMTVIRKIQVSGHLGGSVVEPLPLALS